jgi:hypothetical protein
MGFKNILLFLKHKVYVFYFELFFMFINFYKFINYSIKSTNIFFADQKILGYILNLSNYNYDINNNYIAGIPIIVIT